MAGDLLVLVGLAGAATLATPSAVIELVVVERIVDGVDLPPSGHAQNLDAGAVRFTRPTWHARRGLVP